MRLCRVVQVLKIVHNVSHISLEKNIGGAYIIPGGGEQSGLTRLPNAEGTQSLKAQAPSDNVKTAANDSANLGFNLVTV